jgi:uncharacterized protein (DUF885 family)
MNRRNLIAVTFALVVTAPGAFAAADWIEKSNAWTEPVLEYQSKYFPENASFFGNDKYDEEVIDLNPEVFERFQADGQKVLASLKAALPDETDAKVRQDLEILIKTVSDQLESARLNRELMLPFIDVGQNVFQGLQVLLDARNSPERQARAIERLRKYAGASKGHAPTVELAKQRTAERFGVEGLTGPYIEELTKSMKNTELFIGGIADMFRDAKLKDWQAAHRKLARQLRDYNKWIKKELVPRARADNRLPERIYADNVKNFGVSMDPRVLMDRALFGFTEIRDEMQVIAAQIAAERNLPSSDYRDVIRELKKQQVEGEAILPLYKNVLASLEKMIDEHHIVTLPARESVIRLASEAESAASPAPYMNPPRLIGNTGEYGEFVLPLRNPTAADAEAVMDDFTNEGFAWTLTAHESRPGHELQFSAMVETGVSLARAIFAFNSANVEGWGLYAEAIMKEHLPPEGQLFALQNRLLRAARAFIDPMLNLGLMKPEEAHRFLVKEVCYSEPFATQEVDRYTYRAPGQATSYYYGYMQIKALRLEAELALRDRFTQRAFHDFILLQGLLPPEQLRKAVMEEFVPSQRGT